MTLAIWVLAVSVAITVYAYILYPLVLLALVSVRRRRSVLGIAPAEWPRLSITLPAFNAEATLRPVLDALVRADYPPDRRQILVVSDGSTDGTDAIVREYADHGVELLRVEGRHGKTEAENRALDALTGDIVVNTDASVTIRTDALKQLVMALEDPGVGVASGRDVSVESVGATGHGGEAAYVGYEMWVRELETAADGIVGSSGCLYAVRAQLHRRTLPGHLSRDFSSALWARLNGLRAVSVRDAVCYVPRAASARVEYRRKIRTMSRGIQTLFYHAELLDPLRHGRFAILLWSHKLLRWLVPWALAAGTAAVLVAALLAPPAWPAAVLATRVLAGATVGMLMLAAAGWWWPRGNAPRLASTAAFLVSGTIAGLLAWKRALADQRAPVWDPTPRALADPSAAR